jgi:hypothetical protein
MDLRSYRRSRPVAHTNQIGSARGDAFGNFLAPVVRTLLGVAGPTVRHCLISERHWGGVRPWTGSRARRPRDTRPASQTRHAGSLPLTPSLLFPDGREHGWIATIFKRPFPIPLQLVVPQVLARMRLDEWHEELARHIAQALQ